jgi:hypothetical protein
VHHHASMPAVTRAMVDMLVEAREGTKPLVVLQRAFAIPMIDGIHMCLFRHENGPSEGNFEDPVAPPMLFVNPCRYRQNSCMLDGRPYPQPKRVILKHKFTDGQTRTYACFDDHNRVPTARPAALKEGRLDCLLRPFQWIWRKVDKLFKRCTA